MLQRPIVFIDSETTGVGPTAQPWEIGLIVRSDHGDDEFRYLLPVNPAEADPYALDVGGFWERHPDHARGVTPAGEVSDPPVVAKEVGQLTHRAILVGVNNGYDMNLLDRWMRQHGTQPTWDYHPYDMEAVSVGWLLGQGIAPQATAAGVAWRSHQLSEACGVPVPAATDRHTALGDARWARDWFDALNLSWGGSIPAYSGATMRSHAPAAAAQ